MLINEIYESVLAVSNKSQVGGYLKPSRFNEYINMSQQDVIDEVDRFAAHNRRVISLLRDIIKTQDAPVGSLGQVELPADYYRYLDANAVYFDDGKRQIYPIDYISKTERGERVRSKIVSPELSSPIATEGFSGLMVEPTNINIIELTYLFKPELAVWNSTGTVPPVFDPDTSVDVALGRQFKNILTFKVCKYFGIEIREADLVNATTKNLIEEFGIST